MLTTVYREAPDNLPPETVTLLYPEDDATVYTTCLFVWSESSDPHGDDITYTVQLAEDSGFTTGLIEKEGLTDTAVVLTAEDGIVDGQTYYWQVIPVDEYGASPGMNPHGYFHVDNNNPDWPGHIVGTVRDANGDPIPGATVTLSPGGLTTITSERGLYLFAELNPMSYTVSVEADGFIGDATTESVPEGEVIELDFQLTDTLWVDFANMDTESGIYGEPFNTLDEAIALIPEGGTIKIKGNSSVTWTDWAGQISQAMRIEAINGPVRLGASPGPGKAASGTVVPCGTYTTGGKEGPAGVMGAINLALALAGNEQYDVDHTQIELESEVEEAKTVYEAVIPFTKVEDGLRAAHADSVLAIRLRSEAEIDPESIWGPVPNYTDDEVTAEWQPVVEGDLRDVWVIFRPNETWYLDEVISVTVGAETVSGEPVEPVTFQFRTESEEDYFERVTEPVEPVWQPQYDEDFDAAGLDLTAESTDTAVLTPAGEQTASTRLSDGLDAPFTIGPERVYDTPQRVWLPVPEDVDPDEVRLYYYHPTGDDRGWYPAETVAGWLVPDSYLELDIDGTTYLGFLVRHAGIVQLGIPPQHQRD